MKHNVIGAITAIILTFIFSGCSGGSSPALMENQAKMEKELQQRQALLEQEMRQKQIKMEQEMKELKEQVKDLTARFEGHGHTFNTVTGPRIFQKKLDFYTALAGGNVWWLTDRAVDRSRLKAKWEKLVSERAWIDLSPGHKYGEYKEAND